MSTDLCYCDPSYYIPKPPECSLPAFKACLAYNLFTVIIFSLEFLFICHETYTQLFKDRKRVKLFKYGKRLKFCGYIALILACATRAVRYALAAVMFYATDTLNSLYFLALLLVFTSYTFLISVWIHVLLVATNRPSVYLKILKVFAVCANILPYTLLLVELNVDPTFWFWKANAVAFILIFFIGAGYGFFGKKIEVIALRSEAIAGKTKRENAIRKVTRRTYWISVVSTSFLVVTVTAAGISYAVDSVAFFLTRHFIYRMFEITLISLLTIVLRSRSDKAAMDNANVSGVTLSEKA